MAGDRQGAAWRGAGSGSGPERAGLTARRGWGAGSGWAGGSRPQLAQTDWRRGGEDVQKAGSRCRRGREPLPGGRAQRRRRRQEGAGGAERAPTPAHSSLCRSAGRARAARAHGDTPATRSPTPGRLPGLCAWYKSLHRGWVPALAPAPCLALAALAGLPVGE